MTSQEIELEICKYIEENAGTTINQVADHMTKKGICSRMTTLKKIDDLKSRERQIIEDKREANSFHRLYINSKNEFNRIDNKLSEIENIIDAMDEPLRRFSEIEFGTHNPEFDVEITDLLRNFQGPYEQAMDLILQELIARTENKIHSEKDKQILYTKIIKLLQKFIVQLSRTDIKTVEMFDRLISRLKHVQRSSFPEVKKINVNLVNNSQKIAGEFEKVLVKIKKEFLSKEQ